MEQISLTPSPVTRTKAVDFRGMTFEGGGVLGIAHVAVLETLEKQGIPMTQYTHFSGSSAGSVLAMGMACRYSVAGMKEILEATNFNNFKDGSWFTIVNVYRAIARLGWYKGDALENWIGDILDKVVGPGGRDITFEQAYKKYGTYLLITMTRVRYPSSETVMANWKTFPNLPIRVAVRRSTSIPGYFTAMHGNPAYGPETADDLYVDGGLLDNYPIQALYDELPSAQVMGIKLISRISLKEIRSRDIAQSRAINGPAEFAESIITSLRNQALKLHIDPDDWTRTVKVDVGTLSAFNFNLTTTDQSTLLVAGHNAALEFLNCMPTL